MTTEYRMRKKEDRLKLASRFRKVASDFRELCIKYNLSDTKVDMDEPFDRRGCHHRLCDTPACHGGWGAILYGVIGNDMDTLDFYLQGADLIAKELGFHSRNHLISWADNYPEYWGNDEGQYMFNGPEAFDQDCINFPFPVIYEHYDSVADRLEDKLTCF